MVDGDYVMRVRAIDNLGLQGEDSIHRFTVDARPTAPLVIAPTIDAIVREVRPEFRWVRSEPAEKYRLQLAKDRNFSEPLVDKSDLAANHYTLMTALIPGDYYWRLATINVTGEQGPFTNPLRFELRLGPATS